MLHLVVLFMVRSFSTILFTTWRESALVVYVRAQGHLKQHRPDGRERFTLDLPAGATVRTLIEASGIPWGEIGLVAVGGAGADDDRLLAEGDEVMLIAPMEGG